MASYKFGDIVKEVKINIDRNNNPYEFYVAGDHMDSEDLTIHRKGIFASDDVGPAFTRLFKPGQVLYGSRRTYLKKVAVADFEGICSNTTFVLEGKAPDKFDERLLPFIMLSDGFTQWSVSHSKGSTNPYILFSDLASYEFELPTMEKQRKLADKLWSAYHLKEAYQKLLSATDEMVKSQFIELIRDCQTYLSISDLSLNFLKGITPTYVESSCVEVINQACVTWDGIDFSNVKYQNSESSFAKGILNSDDLLLTMTGRGTLGRCNIFFPENDDITYIADSHISILRVNKTLVLPIIIAKFISLSDTQDEIYRNYVTGSTNQLDIVFSKIKNFKIPVPPMALQEEFAAIVSQADKSKFELKRAIEAIDKVIKSLING